MSATDPVDQPAPAVPPAPADHLAAAAAKAGLVWVLPDAATGTGQYAQALWHAWHEEAVLVVVGGGEQPDPLVGRGTARVRVPSKDTGGALVDVDVRVEVLEPRTQNWDAAVFRLRAGRLNAPDADHLTDRWAEGSRVLRLVPHGPSEPATDQGSGAVEVDVERVRPRGWRPLRSRLRGRAPRR